MSVFSTVVVAVHLLAGVLLGGFSPIAGLALLVGAVAVTASLWWQVGLANIVTPHAYMLGLAAGMWVGNTWHREGTPLPEVIVRVRKLAWLTIGAIAVSTSLAIARDWIPLEAVRGLPPVPIAEQLATLRPGGPGGTLQAAFVAAIGPLLLALSAPVLMQPTAIRRIRRALVAGATLAVLSPVVQFLFLTPWVRPDRRQVRGRSLVAFFQDQHSFAAYLVLIIGVVAGLLAAHLWASERRTAAGTAILGLALVVTLYGTDSRGAALAALLTLFYFAGGLASEALARRTGHSPMAVLTAAMIVLAIGVAAFPATRGAALGALSRMDDPTEAASGTITQSLGWRPVLWRKSTLFITSRPLWGVGPGGFTTVPEELAADPELAEAVFLGENAHNYFLQFAAELGVPALLCFIALLVTCLTVTIRTATRTPRSRDQLLLLGVACGQIGFVAFSLVSHPLLLAELQAVFWTVTGLGLAIALRLQEPVDGGHR